MRYWQAKIVSVTEGGEDGSNYHRLLRDRPGTNLNRSISGETCSTSGPCTLVVVDPQDVLI
jgi:hypothetical protein